MASYKPECKICFQLYQDPRFLPCGHTFCRLCVIGIFKRDGLFRCPTCNTGFEKDALQVLPRNFEVQLVVTMFEIRDEDNDKDDQLNNRSFKRIKLDEACTKHPEAEGQFFCAENSCEVIVCSLCVTELHCRHKLVSLQRGRDDIVAEFSSLIRSVRDAMENVQQTEWKRKDFRNSVAAKTEARIWDVNQRVDVIIANIERVRINLLVSAQRKACELLLKANFDKCEGILALLAAADRCISKMDDLINHATLTQLLEHRADTETQFAKLLTLLDKHYWDAPEFSEQTIIGSCMLDELDALNLTVCKLVDRTAIENRETGPAVEVAHEENASDTYVEAMEAETVNLSALAQSQQEPDHLEDQEQRRENELSESQHQQESSSSSPLVALPCILPIRSENIAPSSHESDVKPYTEEQSIATASLPHPFLVTTHRFTDVSDANANTTANANPKTQVLICAGGRNGTCCVGTAECYDPEKNCWFSIAPMLQPRWNAAAAALDGHLIVAGGWDWRNKKQLSSVERFDPESNSWSMLPSLGVARVDHALVASDGFLLAVGGCADGSPLNNIECYVPNVGWHFPTVLRTARSAIAAAVWRDCAVVAGGRNNGLALSSCELVSWRSNNWRCADIGSLTTERCWAACTSYRDTVFIFGGFNSSGCLASAEQYDAVADRWYKLTWYGTARRELSAVCVNDNIYIVGGYCNKRSSPSQQKQVLATVERFQPLTRRFSYASSMHMPRRGHASACVSISEHSLRRLALYRE